MAADLNRSHGKHMRVRFRFYTPAQGKSWSVMCSTGPIGCISGTIIRLRELEKMNNPTCVALLFGSEDADT